MAKYTPKTKDELKKLVQDENIYLGDIDTSNITNMCGLFYKSARRDFSGVESWDTSKVTNMSDMFCNVKSFNENINSWDTSKVTDMSYMFNGAERFNQPLNNWNISSVVDMNGMFCGAKSFNQSLNKWDTSSVANMNGMFWGAKSFNQSLDKWNTYNVVNMRCMFFRAKSFNQPLNSWDTSSVVNMEEMFSEAIKFNQPLDSWDTSSVEFMTRMFKGAESFNQNLNSWDVSSIRDNQEMFWDSGMSKLPKWYKKRVFSDDFDAITEEGRNIVKEAIANPRPKKPKIAPQDKPKSNANDWGNLRQNYDLSKLSLKSKIAIAFSILFVVAICFNVFKSMLSDSDTKTQPTQTAKPKQMQSAQQPTANMPRCDDKDLLNHIIKSFKNASVAVNNQDAELFAKKQELYRQHGINLTSAEEYANSLKCNLANVQTKTRDEANKQVVCEVEMEIVYPIPLPRFYAIIDYRAQLTDNNEIEFEWLGMRELDK